MLDSENTDVQTWYRSVRHGLDQVQESTLSKLVSASDRSGVVSRIIPITELLGVEPDSCSDLLLELQANQLLSVSGISTLRPHIRLEHKNRGPRRAHHHER